MQYADEWRAFHKFYTLQDKENNKKYNRGNNEK